MAACTFQVKTMASKQVEGGVKLGLIFARRCCRVMVLKGAAIRENWKRADLLPNDSGKNGQL